VEGQVEIAARINDARDRLFGSLPIVGGQQGQKQLVGDGLIVCHTEQAPRRRGPDQIACGEVKIPGSDAETLGAEPQFLVPSGFPGWVKN
jgi:hypothetical protein